FAAPGLAAANYIQQQQQQQPTPFAAARVSLPSARHSLSSRQEAESAPVFGARPALSGQGGTEGQGPQGARQTSRQRLDVKLQELGLDRTCSPIWT
ncbi:unnamed protein product, partial [Polarella glacialis]